MEGVYEQKIFSFPKSDFRAQTNGDWFLGKCPEFVIFTNIGWI